MTTHIHHFPVWLRLFLISFFVLNVLNSCVDEEQPNNDIRGNFEALWNIIDQHYCFFDYKAQEIGLDWNAVHDKYSTRLTSTMTNTQFFEVMDSMLSELQDGHVNLYIGEDVGRNWSWYENYPHNLSTELRDDYLQQHNYKIASGLKYCILDDNIGYIVYESFENAVGEGNLSDCLYYLRACNGLIFDVRSNSGGQLTYANRIAQRFTNEKVLAGYSTYKTGTGHSDFAEPQPEYITPSDGIRWQKPVIVLTNRQCYSATNTFVRNMRACGATILGDQTGGGSGMPFNSELPNGWLVRYSASPQFDKDMHQIEFGIQPDYYCSLDSTDMWNHHDTLIEKARSLLR